MVLTDAQLDDSHGQQLAVAVNPAKAEMFFTGTDQTFAALLQLALDGKALPRFPLPTSIRASLATEVKSLTSDNVVGILPGTDPRLKDEYVVVSSHIDHLGEGVQRDDAIYNGAMDNATGAATLIETAAESARRNGFKRSVVFLATTAEEKGLLGAQYYAHRPTVPASAIVANLNTDTILPLYPMNGLLALGFDESDLAGDVVSVARALSLEVYPDAEPERRMFVRNDHYSFVRTGVPSISLKIGFKKESSEHELVRRWRTARYHSPTDDLAQPFDRQAAQDFNRAFLMVLESVANRASKPAWNVKSSFRP